VNSRCRYAAPRDRVQHNATYWTNVVLKREEVLALWPDPVPDILWAKTEGLTLAEAVALLVRGRPASKKVWRRLRRRHGGRFPAAIEEKNRGGRPGNCGDTETTRVHRLRSPLRP
jgi:hypothetical protein